MLMMAYDSVSMHYMARMLPPQPLASISVANMGTEDQRKGWNDRPTYKAVISVGGRVRTTCIKENKL